MRVDPRPGGAAYSPGPDDFGAFLAILAEWSADMPISRAELETFARFWTEDRRGRFGPTAPKTRRQWLKALEERMYLDAERAMRRRGG